MEWPLFNLLVIFITTLILTILVAFHYYRLDKYDPEPIPNLIFAFSMGMISPVISVSTIILFRILVFLLINYELGEFIDVVMIIPIIEELAKALVLLIIVKTIRIDGLLDGFVYGVMVGSGFAIIENLYFAWVELTNSGLIAATLLSIIRGSFTFIGHPLYTGLVGMGMGAYQVENISNKFAYFLKACLMHMSWNFVFYTPGLFSYNFFLFIVCSIMVIGYSIIVIKNDLGLALDAEEQLFKLGYYTNKRKYRLFIVKQ